MNPCCYYWIDLAPELAGMKVSQLEKLIKKGIPRSTFSPVLRIIEGMGKCCPLCGSQIKQINDTHVPQQTAKKDAPIKQTESKSPSAITCPPCRGTGKIGDNLNCMTCYGEGKLTKDNPHRKQFDATFAEEEYSKLAENERRKAVVEEEIKNNPKPLREDAKPENWNKL